MPGLDATEILMTSLWNALLEARILLSLAEQYAAIHRSIIIFTLMRGGTE
jgi:hypothetical protein